MAGDNWWMIKNNVQPNISKFENGLRIETEILVETNFNLSFFLFYHSKVLLLVILFTIKQLTLSWQRPLSYGNQSTDFLCKSMNWFLYDKGLRHERVKGFEPLRLWVWDYPTGKYQLKAYTEKPQGLFCECFAECVQS